MVSKYKTAHEKQLKEQKAKIREMEGTRFSFLRVSENCLILQFIKYLQERTF